VSEIVAHINGKYGSLDFIPVHHYHQTIKKDEFYALLSVADLALITPLRDGMNTTSMEFVIAQEHTKKSPLVLSEFMGISNNMSEALQINPWDLGDVAAAINRGLTMSPGDKAARHDKMYKVVNIHTSHSWAATLVKILLKQMGHENVMARKTPFMEKNRLEGWYLKAKKRLFLFDYDVSPPQRKCFQRANTSLSLSVGHFDTYRQDPKHGPSLSGNNRGARATVRGSQEFGVHHLWP
jgi:trehalose 6-phosphate synthase/phosphatase